FAVAAGAGAAYWWMSRWTFGSWRTAATHLEALLPAQVAEGLAAEAPVVAQPVAEVMIEAVETVQAPVEAASEAAAEIVETPAEVAPA
ncbi:hypothetical protein, partial [Enterococcus faecium]